ncbi:MerR family transcriptional regulator [Marinicauda algicola]|uniref:MerR family transcriptional regulator n=1 Tax=Marinicauda algicola TaxID=2029849 RepID=A0A4S2GW97_9PROT|nr:helix-turn-helix domain-containing protein [Marinicauda algicola]TGY87081.1 MerR family transcriptional regulator [Marinicauda algicola]
MRGKPMTIGRISKAAGVKVTTIRYYESIGLMGTPDRSESGQRLYGPDAVERLSFIRHARDLGFSVDSIRDLIALQTTPQADCAAIDAAARRQLANVGERIARLRALEGELERMVRSCEGGAVATCAVLASLADHDQCASDDHGPRDIAL